MHTLSSIVTLAKLSIQTFSPIQTLSPIQRFHGYLMFIVGFIVVFSPILAPKAFSIFTLRLEEIINEFLKKRILIKYQAI